MFERLAPELAWPIVALIALPFIIWKFNDWIAAIKNTKSFVDGLTSKNAESLVVNLPNLTSLVDNLPKIVDANTNKQLHEHQETQSRELRYFEEANTIQEEDENELEKRVEVLIGQPGSDAEQAAVPQAGEMLEDVVRSWSQLTDALAQAYERAQLGKPDTRSVGIAVRKLADRRRTNAL